MTARSFIQTGSLLVGAVMAAPALAGVPSLCEVPEVQICGITPANVCPADMVLVFGDPTRECRCCAWCHPDPNYEPGCLPDVGGGTASCYGAQGSPPHPKPSCDVSLPECWVCTVIQNPQPSYPIGSQITFVAQLVDSCDPYEAVDWTICAGSNLVVPIAWTATTLTVCVVGSGEVVAVARQGTGWGNWSVEKHVDVGTCTGDLNSDGAINGTDLAILLGSFGSPGCGGRACCPSDIDRDGDVDAADMALLLGAFGPCP